jgi:hypothetical protein
MSKLNGLSDFVGRELDKLPPVDYSAVDYSSIPERRFRSGARLAWLSAAGVGIAAAITLVALSGLLRPAHEATPVSFVAENSAWVETLVSDDYSTAEMNASFLEP